MKSKPNDETSVRHLFSTAYSMKETVAGLEQDKWVPPELVVFSRPDSLCAESCRFLRSSITHHSADNPPRSILITSALMGEGKTFVACNLAASISQMREEHALLVDADLRNPSAHKSFGIPSAERGLSTYLAGSAGLPDLLKKTNFDKLTILPAGNSAMAPAELLSSERMRSLIQELRDRYRDRFIIIDSAPLELAPETSVIANAVDAVLLVVLHGKTPRNLVKQAVKKIKKEKFMGVVYNAYNEPFKLYDRYGYYKYGYGKKKKPA
jgi:exopolysaccharide/PEP-CTERM locus tyrosine autokinase